MSRDAPTGAGDVAALIAAEVLGVVTTHDAHGYLATPLPLLARCDETGAVREIIGHFGRSNPHVARVRDTPTALITFLGPHRYIAPAMVSREGWAPTWNYQFAQLEVEIALDEVENDAAIRALVCHLEGEGADAWTVDRVGPRYDRLVANVVAFRARVTSMAASFKLGQDEDRRTFDEIVGALGTDPLAAAMRVQRPDGR